MKNKSTIHLGIVLASCISSIVVSYSQKISEIKRVPQLGKNNISEVVAAMTLEEKALMVIGGGRNGTGIDMGDGSMIGRTESKLPGAAGCTNAIPRLGIPALVLPDGPAGVRIDVKRKGDNRFYYATAFPSETTLASSWDTELVRKVGVAFGEEVLDYGADIILAPGANIHRNPLGGRNFEYYSEDPVIAGNMAAAMINGLQSKGIGTSLKHFVANNQEANRAGIDEIISERALREIYLKVFEIAVKKSQPWTVMSSYNLVNGIHTSERADLLSTILRDEWGFKGYVMTDWGGKAKDLIAQMNAGNDMIMPGNVDQVQRIISAVKNDSLSEKILDRNVEHILNIIVKTPSFRHYAYAQRTNLDSHATIARQAGAEGMVLLENHEHTLPFSKSQKHVALLGNMSYSTIAGGTGSGDVNKAHVISLYNGFNNAGFVMDTLLSRRYQEYVANYKNRSNELYISDSLIERLSRVSESAVITIGRNSGETKDRDLDSNYSLKPSEFSLINRTAKAFHSKGKKVTIILNICGPIDTKKWRDEVDAVLLAGQPGQEAGDAILDVLTGKVNPSGKLATSFVENYNDVSSAANFPGLTSGLDQVKYKEGIYIGYRYLDKSNIRPSYEFGYGLSYTTFSVHSLKLLSKNIKDKLSFTCMVTNTGKVAGREVLQAYVSAPSMTIDKPNKELKAFAKTKLLQPNESQTLTFTIPVAEIASFYNDKNEWMVEAGNYQLLLGTSSRKLEQTVSFKIPEMIITEKVHSVMHPTVAISE